MKRNEHLFQFSGNVISQAAKAEREYHADRVAYWKDEYSLAVAKAKEAGVEIQEYPVSGGFHAQMVLNPALQARMTECYNKIQSHQGAADRFQIEAAAYATQGERVFELHPDDIVYFRLAGSPRPD